MVDESKQIAKKIADSAEEIQTYKKNKKLIVEKLNELETQLKNKKISQDEFNKSAQKYLQGKTKEEVIKSHNNYINLLFDEIEKDVDKLMLVYNLDHKDSKKSEYVDEKQIVKIKKKDKEKFMQQVGLDKYFLKLYKLRKKKKESQEIRVEYQLYQQTSFGTIANRIFEKLTIKLTKSSPELFEPLFQSLRMSGLKILSKTYISIMFFSGLLTLLATWPFIFLVYPHPVLAIRIVRAFVLGLLLGIGAILVAYFYPQSLAKQRAKAIKEDLPFMVIHMSAVAGSGAKPISMFKTILASGEYPALRDEVKKIVNYVTLFGYNLSTALKAVAKRTPSVRFKDLLDSLVANIESGGDMKEFLEAMADESMTTYRLERKRYVKSIETYSDIYTAVLIAAPLLFFATLAIIQTLGGTIAGVSVSAIANVGTFGVIPALNLAFLFFLQVVAPQ